MAMHEDAQMGSLVRMLIEEAFEAAVHRQYGTVDAKLGQLKILAEQQGEAILLPAQGDEVEDDPEIDYERECPYFAKFHNFQGHDPRAVCAFECREEPICVTGSWLTAAQFQALRDEFENVPPTLEWNRQFQIYTHTLAACDGTNCTLHNPSPHHMVDWPMVLRGSGLIERTCPHGVGHPDPDSARYYIDRTGEDHWGIHGCDGCCR